MVTAELATIIHGIHGAGRKLVFEFAGAGSFALFWLHAVPGSSRTVLEATDRYSESSMADLLGAIPEKSVSRETVMAMATRAYRRAMRLTDGVQPCIGVACTAAIATDRERRGANHGWVACRSRDRMVLYHLHLAKGARDRVAEEELISRLVIATIADPMADVLPSLVLGPDDQLEQSLVHLADPIADLLDGQVSHVLVGTDGAVEASAHVSGGLLSGSFNPLHAGHERLAQAAALALGRPVTFELAVVNADKPPLGYATIEQRLAQFHGRAAVALSRAPLFVEKAQIYPGCVFIVGFDTAVRLVDPRYYQGEAGRDSALATIRAAGCRFLVAGRVQGAIFKTLHDLPVPRAFSDLFSALPERAFRVDISSSEIRAVTEAGLVSEH